MQTNILNYLFLNQVKVENIFTDIEQKLQKTSIMNLI